MKCWAKTTCLSLLVGAGNALAADPPPPAPMGPPVQVEYLYNLSTMTGVVTSSAARLSYDPVNQETFTVGDGVVRIFNETGMEIFSFAAESGDGVVFGMAPLDDGDMLLLLYDTQKTSLARANFRGEVKGRIELKGLPASLKGEFGIGAIGSAKGKIYLADPGNMRVVVTDMEGNFLKVHDLAEAAGLGDKRQDEGIRGFHVSPAGDILYTIPTQFLACVLPDGESSPTCFGTKGSAPGKFNVVVAVAVDEDRNFYVADILKSAVLVFDRNLRWLKEFGYRGRKAGNLNSPVDLVAGRGKLFVSQYGGRGVSVFKLSTPKE